jgi:8-oxo-dGTP pyrophosphatase MutT (NUDIX family)
VKIDPRALRERLAARAPKPMHIDGFRESAVLAPIVSEPGQDDSLLLTLRRADLSTHAGQISFPGGKRDPNDMDAAATALRETSEELGIAPAYVDVLGMLDDIPTPTGFVITPVVARIEGPIELSPSAHEVAEVVRCPLDELRRPEAYRENGERTFLGVTYVMLEYQFGSHRIWGATARIIHQLLALL